LPRSHQRRGRGAAQPHRCRRYDAQLKSTLLPESRGAVTHEFHAHALQLTARAASPLRFHARPLMRCCMRLLDFALCLRLRSLSEISFHAPPERASSSSGTARAIITQLAETASPHVTHTRIHMHSRVTIRRIISFSASATPYAQAWLSQIRRRGAMHASAETPMSQPILRDSNLSQRQMIRQSRATRTTAPTSYRRAQYFISEAATSAHHMAKRHGESAPSVYLRNQRRRVSARLLLQL
jgi:hypothetical protein